MGTEACAYCGAEADTTDHLVAYGSWYERQRRRLNQFDATVPACRECNCFLGALPYTELPDRAGYLAGLRKVRTGYSPDRLRHLARIASTPVWAEPKLIEVWARPSVFEITHWLRQPKGWRHWRDERRSGAG